MFSIIWSRVWAKFESIANKSIEIEFGAYLILIRGWDN